jgi:hypothetical protein
VSLKSLELQSLQTGTSDAESRGVSVIRLSLYRLTQVPFGVDQPSGSQLRFDRTSEEKRFRASGSTGAPAQKPALHDFAIEDLGQAGWLAPRRYRYFCMKCRWLFLIENRLGDATAVDGSGRPLREPEQSTRVATFALGPCPAAPRQIGVVCEKRDFGHRLTHPAKECQRESAKSGSTLLRTLLTGLRTVITKRLSSRAFCARPGKAMKHSRNHCRLVSVPSRWR